MQMKPKHVGLFALLLLLAPAAAQQTSVPSGPTSPAGTTNYDTVRRRAGFISYLSERLNTRTLDAEQRARIVELGPEIVRQMPAEGGVLIFAWIATEKQTGAGLPKSRQLRTVTVAAAGLTRGEALRRYESDEKRLVADPSRPNDQFFEVKREEIWVTAREVLTPKATPAMEELLHEYDAKARQLDADWKWIAAEHRFLESKGEDKPAGHTTNQDAAQETAGELGRAQELLRVWMGAQQKLVAQQRDTASARAGDLAQERQRLATTERDTATLKRQLDGMVYTQCPNRCAFAQCTHEDRKKAYSDTVNAMKADHDNRVRAIDEWRRSVMAKEQALDGLNRELADRSARHDKQRAQKETHIEHLKEKLLKQRADAAKDAEQQASSETEFAARLRTYRQNKQKLHDLERKIYIAASGLAPDK